MRSLGSSVMLLGNVLCPSVSLEEEVSLWKHKSMHFLDPKPLCFPPFYLVKSSISLLIKIFIRGQEEGKVGFTLLPFSCMFFPPNLGPLDSICKTLL